MTQTETTENPAYTTSSQATTDKLTINQTDASIHLAILGDRSEYLIFSKNFKLYEKKPDDPNAKRTIRLPKSDIIDTAEKFNNEGFTFWISLNPKEADGNINVIALADFWLDIDVERPKDRPANETELKEAYDRALALKNYIEKTYGAVCFIAFSGNGYHLHFPLPITSIAPKNRETVNLKVRAFAKKTAATINKVIDSTYDINRKTTLIGSYNLKYESVVQTYWLDLPQDAQGAVQYARRQNQKLLDAILATPTEQEQHSTTYQDTTKPHAQLDMILSQDTKLCDLYNGDWKKHGYPTRSEAEAAVLTILFGRYGFSTDEAREAMEKCKIGKWQERPDGYRETTIQNAHKYVMDNPTQTPTNTQEPKQEYSEFTSKLAEFAVNPDLQKIIIDEIELTVKNDRPIKTSLFHAGLSAYATPTNVSLKGETGLGKTYNATETMKYFPQNDILYLGGLSPKAIIHENGILLDKDGNQIKTEEMPLKPSREGKKAEDYEKEKTTYEKEIRKYMEKMRGSYTLIDLSNKILMFLEAPSYETFEMLKPILSHDKPEIHYKFVDKTGKGQMITKHVVIRGAPATICLSVEKKYMSEYATRTFTATPEASKEKIKAANKLTNDQNSYPWNYEEETETSKLIKALIIEIKRLMLEEKIQIVNPFAKLSEIFPKDLVRDMRDFQHFNQLLKAFTMLHIYQRPIIEIKGKKYAITAAQDVINAFRVFNEIFETTRTGTDKRILEFYRENVKTHTKGINIKQATESYNITASTNNEKKLSSFTIRRWFERLEEIAYVDKQDDPSNKSRNIYIPLITEDKQENSFADLCKSENQMILASNLEEGFKTWLDGVLQSCKYYNIKMSPHNSIIALNEAQVKDLILTYDSEFCNALKGVKADLEAKKKAEELCKQEKQSSATLIPSPKEPEKSALGESNIVSAARFKRQPGVNCQVTEHDEPCILEAEFSINGNLFCPAHFEVEREILKQQGRACLVSPKEEALLEVAT